MHKIDNLSIIKKKNIKLYDMLFKNKGDDKGSAALFQAKDGTGSLKVMIDGNYYFYHSKYNPRSEAKVISEKYADLYDKDHLLFIGAGLGYHITEILDAYPDIKFSIFEPNKDVLLIFLENFNLKKYKKRLLEIFTSDEYIANRQVFFKYYSSKTKDIILPIVKQLYGKEIVGFQSNIASVMEQKKESIRVDAQLQKRWTINPIMNFPKLLKTPNLLIDLNKSNFKGKPVIIVSAGPSLYEDLEYIRKIKKEKRAYIFAVGSAINALIAKDIYPDAFFSVDPNYGNQFVVEKLKVKNLNIPLVFGSSIGFEVLNDYPGKLISFMLNQDQFSKYLLKYDEDIIVHDAVSVANMTLQPLLKLEMNPIIFAGQNLAYLNDRVYAEGIKYEHNSGEVTKAQLEDSKKVISVSGEKLATSNELLKMKYNMEYFISKNPEFDYINTTKNGAQIEGTRFISIEKVLEEILVEKNIVENNWIEAEPSYDVEFAKENFKKLEKAFDELMKLCEKNLEYITIISEMNKTGQYQKLEIYLTAFDKLFEIIQENDFFNVIVHPMTRVQHESFIIRTPEVAQERLPRKKIKLFEEIFGGYMKTIYGAVVYTQPAFYELKKSDFLAN